VIDLVVSGLRSDNPVLSTRQKLQDSLYLAIQSLALMIRPKEMRRSMLKINRQTRT